MRNIPIVMLVLGLVAIAPVWAGECAPPAGKDIAVVGAGAVDAGLVQRVGDFVRQNVMLPVRIAPETEIKGKTLEEIGQAALAAKADTDVVLGVMAAPEEPAEALAATLPENRVVVVNVAALKPADGDAERHGRRVETQAMRGVGLLLGVKPCLNPQCALWSGGEPEDIDYMGRNFCPPCLDAVQEAARGCGLTVIELTPPQ